MILNGPATGVTKVRAARADDGSFAFIYSPRGESFTVNKSLIKADRVKEIWYDPRYGVAYEIHTLQIVGDFRLIRRRLPVGATTGYLSWRMRRLGFLFRGRLNSQQFILPGVLQHGRGERGTLLDHALILGVTSTLCPIPYLTYRGAEFIRTERFNYDQGGGELTFHHVIK